MKKLLKERFQELAGIKPLYEAESTYDMDAYKDDEDFSEPDIADRDMGTGQFVNKQDFKNKYVIKARKDIEQIIGHSIRDIGQVLSTTINFVDDVEGTSADASEHLDKSPFDRFMAIDQHFAERYNPEEINTLKGKELFKYIIYPIMQMHGGGKDMDQLLDTYDEIVDTITQIPDLTPDSTGKSALGGIQQGNYSVFMPDNFKGSLGVGTPEEDMKVLMTYIVGEAKFDGNVSLHAPDLEKFGNNEEIADIILNPDKSKNYDMGTALDDDESDKIDFGQTSEPVQSDTPAANDVRRRNNYRGLGEGRKTLSEQILKLIKKEINKRK